MFTLAVVSISILLSLIRVNAQACDANNLCPESAPCCSEFGYCGSGPQYCLGGCNPLFSNTLGSCAPNAVCKSQTYSFADSSRILEGGMANFDGNPDTYDWVVDGGNIETTDDNLVMILTETNSGTRLSSTRYIHYGTITATLKTGRWDGVVTGFITMSNIRDEIDWEFPGAAVTQGQTNFFWQGQNSHGATSTGLTDTYENYHDFTINWTPESLIFSIDGQVVRTLKASDSLVNGVSQFPSTPARIQLSLWPAGTTASAPGTIAWAGGMIDWTNADYVAAGNQFRAYVKSITVTCADPTAPTANQVSYVYADGSTASKQTISLSTDSPIIGGSAVSSSSSVASTSTSLSATATSVASTTTASDSVTTSVGSSTGVSITTSASDGSASSATTSNSLSSTGTATAITTSTATGAAGDETTTSKTHKGKGNKHTATSSSHRFIAGWTDLASGTATATSVAATPTVDASGNTTDTSGGGGFFGNGGAAAASNYTGTAFVSSTAGSSSASTTATSQKGNGASSRHTAVDPVTLGWLILIPMLAIIL